MKGFSAGALYFIPLDKANQCKTGPFFDTVYNQHLRLKSTRCRNWRTSIEVMCKPWVRKREEVMGKEKERGPRAVWGQAKDHISKSSNLQHCNNDSDIPVGLRKLDSREVGGQSGRNKWL